MLEMRRSASLVCAWIMVLAGDMVRNWLTPTVGQFSCFCQLYAWRNGPVADRRQWEAAILRGGAPPHRLRRRERNEAASFVGSSITLNALCAGNATTNPYPCCH